MTDEKQPPSDETNASQNSPLPPPEAAGDVPSWAKDDKAKLEEKYWDDESRLRGVKIQNDILWHRVYGWAVVVMMCFFVLVFMASLGAWVLHYITPWGWLSPTQLSKIQSVIFSGSLGAIVSAYMQRQLSK